MVANYVESYSIVKLGQLKENKKVNILYQWTFQF